MTVAVTPAWGPQPDAMGMGKTTCGREDDDK
jgi:hypothetical protein